MEKKEKQTDIKPKSPLSMFFALGDKVTGGDPKRKMDFDYYMMWIIFLAFFGVFTGNLRSFFTQGYQWQYIGWSLFAIAIMWFQYFNLMNIWKMRNYQKENALKVEQVMEDRIETVDEMMAGFRKKGKK